MRDVAILDIKHQEPVRRREFACCASNVAKTTINVKNIKDSVQLKLRWVENGVNRSVGASDCGAGHYFQFFVNHRLVLNIFPFSQYSKITRRFL